MNNIFELNWEKCRSGYIIEIHDEQLKLRKAEPYTHTLLTNADNFSGSFIKPKEDDNNQEYKLFKKDWRGIPHTFADLIDEESNSLNHKKVIKFANEYGLLGLPLESGNESLDRWKKWVKEFRHILFFTTKAGGVNFSVAITLYNTLQDSLFFKPKVMPYEYNKGTTKTSKIKSNFYLQPANLISAMYVILGDNLTTGINMQKCKNPNCFKWFPERPNKNVCSQSCKQAIWRSKQNF